MRILAISGSTRAASVNTRVAHLITDVRPDDAVRVWNSLDQLPYFNADLEPLGDPREVAALKSAVTEADLVLLVTPEYNGTTPGVLVNAVDWLSRPHGQSVLRGKRVLVLSAAPGRHGGSRAAEHLRTLVSRLGAETLPYGISVAHAEARLSGTSPDPTLIADLVVALCQASEECASPACA